MIARFSSIAWGGLWLTRLPLTTGVVLVDGRNLEKLLKSFKGDIIDIDAIVRKQGKKCRLVAMRADPKVWAARRAERRKKARDCGKNFCPKGLLRDGWHLMLTHLSREQADVSQLAAIYRARWASGNPIPRMEAGAQPRQSFRSQEQRASFASIGAGRNDRPPTRHEDCTEDWKHSRTSKIDAI